jgi:fructosamine-3-kinase
VKPSALARAIARSVAEETATPFELTGESPVAGGYIHTALALEGEGRDGAVRYFAKACERSREAMLEAEADGLEAIEQAGALRVPRRIVRGHDGGHAWLVLEWLDLVPLGSLSAARLGAGLAAQHRIERPAFGWPRDNFIGASPQANGPGADWLGFWIDRRLVPQLRMAAANRLPSRMIDRGERLAADALALFSGHRPRPALLHGDLWGGNAAALADGTPVVFDPAVYAGDREADLAMTELFGGFPRDFRAAYEDAFPVPDGYGTRRDFYNLYHLLNHANLFAGGYVGQAFDSIERLVAQIG